MNRLTDEDVYQARSEMTLAAMGLGSSCQRCGDVRRKATERVTCGYVALACARCFNEWTREGVELPESWINYEELGARIRMAEKGVLSEGTYAGAPASGFAPFFDAEGWGLFFDARRTLFTAAETFFTTPRP